MTECPTCKNKETIKEIPDNERVLLCDFCFTMLCANCKNKVNPDEVECSNCHEKLFISKEYMLKIIVENYFVNIPASKVPEGKEIDLIRINPHFMNYKLPDINWGWIKFDLEKKKWIFMITEKLRRYSRYKFLKVKPREDDDEDYEILEELNDDSMSIFDNYEIEPMAIFEMIDREVKVKFIPQEGDVPSI